MRVFQPRRTGGVTRGWRERESCYHVPLFPVNITPKTTNKNHRTKIGWKVIEWDSRMNLTQELRVFNGIHVTREC